MSGRVAVYGTLKRGFRANGMLNNASFIGVGLTSVKYRMTDVGFPMIERADEGHPIRVEIYDEPNWKVLDSYEGVPHLYERNVIQIELEDGVTTDAYIYEATKISGRAVQPTNNVLNWRG
jgi:gamma-glutamylcyclotransferase (GGCT)/AIG2-like uncharacterized protein YtfP